MINRSESRNSQAQDRLLHMDLGIASRRSVAPLRAIRSQSDAPSDVRVALLADNLILLDTIIGLVDSLGWKSNVIQIDDLSPSNGFFWNLVVIATTGDSFPIAPICARASRDARQRVIVVSSDHDPQVIADALNSGADDYMIAPFDAEECRARMRSLVDRSGLPSRPRSNVLWIEPMSRTIGIGLRHATLSAREWTLLMLLLDADQHPVASSVIEESIWGTVGRQSTLASVVSRLRDRLQTHRLSGIEILTVRGSGYAVRLRDVDTSLLRPPRDNNGHL